MTPTERLDRLRTVAAWCWPLVACLAVLPLFWFVRVAFDDRRALFACVLYLSVPSFQLITLCTDQVLFPALSASTAALLVESSRRGSRLVGALAGGVLYVAMYCSFALAAAAVIAAAVVVGAAASAPKPQARRLSAPAVGGLVGFVALLAFFRWAFGYEIVTRYRFAMAHHVAWKGWSGAPREVLSFAFLDMLEFALWVGLPLFVLAFCHVVRSTRAIAGRRLDADVGLSLGLALLLGFLALFGKTKGEVARLWLFLVPFLCAVVASELSFIERSGRVKFVRHLIVGLQLTLLLLTKRFQDFW